MDAMDSTPAGALTQLVRRCAGRRRWLLLLLTVLVTVVPTSANLPANLQAMKVSLPARACMR